MHGFSGLVALPVNETSKQLFLLYAIGKALETSMKENEVTVVPTFS